MEETTEGLIVDDPADLPERAPACDACWGLCVCTRGRIKQCPDCKGEKVLERTPEEALKRELSRKGHVGGSKNVGKATLKERKRLFGMYGTAAKASGM